MTSNGDGKLDSALLGDPPGSLQILLGNGNGTFQTGQNIELAPQSLLDFIAADLNGDGFPDLLIDSGFNPSGYYYFYVGNGDGTFTPQQKLVPCVTSVSFGCAAALGHLNGDGKLDIVTAQIGASSLSAISVLIRSGK